MEHAIAVVESARFSRAPLLSKFLLFIVTEALEGRERELSEHRIGVTVFDRPSSYRTVEDNIVRNYARQLRRRLEDYYAAEGSRQPLRIEIPKGGYVPLFRPLSYDTLTRAAPRAEHAAVVNVADPTTPEGIYKPDPERATSTHQRTPQWVWICALSLTAFMLGGFLSWLLSKRAWEQKRAASVTHSAQHQLWAQLFSADRDTLIVPADTALVTVEDMNKRQYSLTEYLSWSSVEHPGLRFDDGLKIRKYTDVESLEIVDQLGRLPEWNGARSSVRVASKLHVEDWKYDNLILIGSIYSIPWIQLIDGELSFHSVYEPKFGSAHIENRRPAPGELARYSNQWSGVNEVDYAVLAFLPNLGHTGHVLLLEGLDGSGMYATRDVLFGEGLQSILKRCTRRDGSLRSFEALLRATSVDSHSTGTQILSVHLLD